MESDSNLLSVDEVAEKLNISSKTIRNLVRRGDIPAHRLGKQIRLSLNQVILATATTPDRIPL
jgi:excisionase family DNA binding protein